MNRTRRTLPGRSQLVTVAALAVALAAGCSSGSAPDAGSSSSASGNTAQPQPLKLKYMASDDARTLPEGATNDNNPFLKYIEDNTHIDVEPIVAPSNGYEDKLNVTMASGDVPDLIKASVSVDWFAKMINEKALSPLNELIDKYGPALRQNIPAEAWDYVTMNGNVYGVPYLYDSTSTNLMYVRKDWLDKLGLKPPKTLDEYVEVFKAFRDRDPDGNGKNDTIGMLLGEKLGYSDPFFGAFGVQTGQWANRDGKLVYSSTLPETKQALEFLAKLYKEKLLDPEFALNKQPNIDQKVVNGKVGILPVRYTATRLNLKDSKARDASAEWIPLEFPVGPQGKSGSKLSKPVSGFFVLPANGKNKEAAIRYLNFIAGDGYKTLELGFENEHWSVKDGKVAINDQIHQRDLYRSRFGIGGLRKDILKIRWDALGSEWKLYENSDYIQRMAIKDEFTALPTASMAKLNDKLANLEAEAFSKIVMGAAPEGEFDKFVAEWRSAGGDQITKEVNDWYTGKNKK